MRCYLRPDQWPEGEEAFSLDPEETHHLLQVLRAKPGQRVKVFDGKGRTGEAEVLMTQGRRTAELKLLSESTAPPPAVEVVLVQAIPREQKMDLLIQKATELGVTRIIPVTTTHAVVHLQADKVEAKRIRWEKIVLNAAKQCGTVWLPILLAPQPLENYLTKTSLGTISLICSLAEGAQPLKAVLQTVDPPTSITVIVGPEGDFTGEELQALENAGAIPVSLGNSVLRVETAAIYALGAIRYEVGD